MTSYLHIVCLDAPAPPDYGGAIDMYYKIRALADAGKKVILHYFDYNPLRHAKGLEATCFSIYAYRRKSFLPSFPLSQPFIIQSRINHQLIQRLNEDDYPILLEGLHCAGIIRFINNRNRIVLRMHNEEAAYYNHLAQNELSFLKRLYFTRESSLLKRYQQKLHKAVKLACLSETDIETFQSAYQFQFVHFIPCFIPWQSLKNKPGKGSYCLYHGNMSVSENEQAALWLIENVFCKLAMPLWIAGKGVSARLSNTAKKYPNVKLLHHPSIEVIDELVVEAHINVLPSLNHTGVKLKLLNALFNGRHCITNENGIKGSRIHQGVMVMERPSEWIHHIQALQNEEFTSYHIREREVILSLYDNRQNAERLSALWRHYR